MSSTKTIGRIFDLTIDVDHFESVEMSRQRQSSIFQFLKIFNHAGFSSEKQNGVQKIQSKSSFTGMSTTKTVGRLFDLTIDCRNVRAEAKLCLQRHSQLLFKSFSSHFPPRIKIHFGSFVPKAKNRQRLHWNVFDDNVQAKLNQILKVFDEDYWRS